MFIDEADIFVEGGRGGDGVASFRREKYRPKGGPDGGSGGAGGSVVIEASGSRGTLSEFRRKRYFRAERGRRGGSQDKMGGRGEDLMVHVPPGTVVSDSGGRVLADLVEPGQRVVAARGGRRGRGNAALVGEAGPLPKFAERGEPGESLEVHLELKLVADAAIVGLPNAGKSTLISRISMARPKIADYPFTTIEPNLGVVHGDEIDFVVTDVPGLIEGAHGGKGMGTEFLRHVERASTIIYLVDMSPDSGRGPLEDLLTLEEELGLFNRELVKRASVAAANKMDLNPPPEALAGLADACAAKGLPLFEISAATGAGLGPFLRHVESMVVRAREEKPVTGPAVLYKALESERPMRVRREADRFVVEGGDVERMVHMTDWNNEEARIHLASRLRRAGVEEILEREGALEGDEVEVAGRVFEFAPDIATPGRGSAGAPTSRDEDEGEEGTDADE
jgi:GTP-binding protein